ncbi:MAG: adenylosuccinate lyase [Pseudomonadota bacterium]
MKTAKIAVAAAVLATLPAASFAMGCSYGKHTPTTAQISCADGTTYNAETGTCVPVTSS